MWLSEAAPATTAEDNDTLSPVPGAQAFLPSTEHEDGELLSVSCRQSLAAALSPAARSVGLARETRVRIDAMANELPAQTTTMHRRAPSKPSAHLWPTHPHNRPHQRSAPTFASRRPQLSAPEYMALVGGVTLSENGAQEHRLAPRHPLRTSTSNAGLSNSLKYGRGFPPPGPTPADVLESELIATSALLGEANQLMSEQRRQAQRDRVRREREFASRAAHAAAQERARLEARAEKDKAMREMRAAREGEYHASLGGSNLGVQRAQLLHLAEQVTDQRPRPSPNCMLIAPPITWPSR
jgi:hypothetical protein